MLGQYSEPFFSTNWPLPRLLMLSCDLSLMLLMRILLFCGCQVIRPGGLWGRLLVCQEFIHPSRRESDQPDLSQPLRLLPLCCCRQCSTHVGPPQVSLNADCRFIFTNHSDGTDLISLSLPPFQVCVHWQADRPFGTCHVPHCGQIRQRTGCCPHWLQRPSY